MRVTLVGRLEPVRGGPDLCTHEGIGGAGHRGQHAVNGAGAERTVLSAVVRGL